MKLNQLLLLSATSFLVYAVSFCGLSAKSLSQTASPTSTSSNLGITVAQSQPVAILAGTFIAGEKPTTGSARIVTENGHRYLEIDAAFSTSDQGPDLHVWGSGKLIQTLIKHDLVDAFWLMIYPITLGGGKRLFADSAVPAAFRVTESQVSPNGVIVVNYERAGAIATGTG